jgi:hypothetical protein
MYFLSHGLTVHLWSFLDVFLSASPQVVDTFDVFDRNVWLAQCSGCAYDGNGSLVVSGSDMLQRTVGTMKGLTSVEASLVKNDNRDDHGIVVSILAE